MPVTVVVGGQFGSEGKGKVAHFFARDMAAAAAIRVGGPNSGHTAVGDNNTTVIFQQLPTAALCPRVLCVIGPGSYLDLERLMMEIHSLELTPERVIIDPAAVIIERRDRDEERSSGLRDAIGSTLSGTGAALQRRLSRTRSVRFAKDELSLSPYVHSTTPVLRSLLDRNERVIIEGTQGFGLSVLHGRDYPHVTSRDTTAASFTAEAGLSPLDIDDIVLVIRTFPIRVAGPSGNLADEIDWVTVTRESGSPNDILERTTVTRAVRRVGRFTPDVVLAAIAVNSPTRLVLNHLDYIDHSAGMSGFPTHRVMSFVRRVEGMIGRKIDYFGLGPATLIPANQAQVRLPA
jgi:adenylosuccinate synthase